MFYCHRPEILKPIILELLIQNPGECTQSVELRSSASTLGARDIGVFHFFSRSSLPLPTKTQVVKVLITEKVLDAGQPKGEETPSTEL